MRNNRIYLYLLFFLLLPLSVGCGVRGGPPEFLGHSAYTFAEDQVAFGPRFPGSNGHAYMQQWLISTLEDMGWEVEAQTFIHFGIELTNYVAHLPDQADNQSPILLGAHYDTRPHADQDPSHPMQPVLGANDGASGVAVLLELARVLGQTPPEIPIWLVFFDGEDSGNLNGWDWIVGSTYFANHLTIEPMGVIIVDMVGDQDLQIYYDRLSNRELSFEIWDTAAELDFDGFVTEYKYSMIDDHTAFNRLGIPAIVLIDFDYPAWHTTEDALDHISPDSLEQVGQTLLTWIYRQTR